MIFLPIEAPRDRRSGKERRSDAALLVEVQKSADTFADLARTFRLFGYPTAAEACLVAEASNRAAIAKATS